jgi:putative oxidoreductase
MNGKEIVGKLFATKNDAGALLIRITLGLVMFPHGAQKLLGWFGGYGFAGTMGYFTEQLGIPYVLALLVVITEFFGSLALIAGAVTRLAALGIGITMTVAVFMGHLQNGFFMNWFGAQEGEGFEYHLLMIGMALALIVSGAGRGSVDRAVVNKLAGAE